ncbi:UvrD-helicase domain-containing protein [Fuerstiella marisgermanici]|uniref:DNA 3'-5' helicase n=1 Tax=Fuerstiella marisgermanici TaxID=1891926 RepID=A0A1P8WGJ7_9PLAN|nr:UvrD-helicase domain-containing protein [Fuerstiella marisgermanici]APZ93172.1 ATP-dependent helicase/nuclease subunit A [Fuerstiella marisgermanici]
MTDAAVADTNSRGKKRTPRNVVIRASAGTGKTFQLSNRYLGQLLSGSAPDEILATTFTRKAAGEILERNMVRLAEAALNAEKCAELAGFLEDPALTCEQCLKLVQNLTRGLHRVRICTLDSFFSQIASSFGFEMGLPPDWTIVDEIDDVRLKNKAVEAVLRNESTKTAVQLMHLLTKGETGRSVSELIRQTVSALYPIFQETDAAAWTSFPKPKKLAAKDLDAAIENLRTAAIPKHKSIEKARDSDYQMALDNNWEGFVSSGMAKKVAAGETTFYKKELDEGTVLIYQRLLIHAKAVLVDMVAQQTEATYQLLCRFDFRYSQLKDDARVLQFDDVTRLLADVAANNNVGRLSFRMDGNISHILLDEFQDTSLAQWQVIRPFAQQVTGRKKGKSFFCVGDVKQAIYGWRGGIAEIFDAIEDELSGLQREALNKSYRSSPTVVETTNHIFNGLRNRTDPDDDGSSVRQWCQKFQDHSTARDELAGYACLETSRLADEDETPADITIAHAAARVAELTRKAPGMSVGVLTRSNRVVGKVIFELRKLGITASEEGGNPLTDSAAVQIIMSLLKLADHPGNSVARFHVATSPLGKALQFTPTDGSYRAEQLARSVRRRLQSEGYGPVLQEWAGILTHHSGPRGKRRLSQLVELGYVWQTHATLRTVDFLNFLDLRKVPDPTSDNVRVMTVHQSKGLEFDIVVLPDLDTKLVGQPSQFVANKPSPTERIDRVCRYRNSDIRELLPADFQKMFDDARRTEISEALCVLYVAVTRAVHALHMVIAPSRKSEKKVPKTISGLLRSALTNGAPAEPEQQLYEHGQPDWCAGHSDAARTSSDTDATAVASAVPPAPVTTSGIRFATMPRGRERGLQRTAPSKHAAHRKVRLSSVIRHDNLPAMDRGTVIHAFFEMIEWLDSAAAPSEAALLAKAEELTTGGLDPQRMVDDFQEMLRQPDIVRGLTSTSYRPPRDLPLSADVQQALAAVKPEQIRLEVHNEHPFAVRDDGQIVSGFVDRLVLIYLDNQLAACDVVDFKTDTLDITNPSAVAEKVEYYRSQLDSYRRVVSQLYRLPVNRISTRLFMVGAGTIENV